MTNDRLNVYAVAHERLARMYDELSRLCERWGEVERARSYRERADMHLREHAARKPGSDARSEK